MTVGTVSVTDMLITSQNHNVSHNDHLPHHPPHPPAAVAAAAHDDDDDVCISLIQLHDDDAQFFVRIIHSAKDIVLVLVLEAQLPDRLKSYPCKFVLKRVNSVTSAVIQPLFVITSECDEDDDN